MAESAIIGALRILLGVDTATYEEGLKKATKQTETFAQGMAKVAGGDLLSKGIQQAGKIAAEAVHGIFVAFGDAINRADELGKAAQKVGVDIETLSKLKFVGELADVSFEQLTTGLGKFSKVISEAQAGGDKASASFAKIGVSVTDAAGRLKPTSDLFGEVAGKFRTMDDGAKKTALSMELFGKAGKELIPFLNTSAEEMAKLTARAEKFGQVIGEDQKNNAQAFNDNLKQISLAGQGLFNIISGQLLGGLVQLTEKFLDVVEQGDYVKRIADGISNAIKEMVIFIYQAVVADALLAESLNALFAAGQAFISLNFEEASKQWQKMKDTIAGFGPAMDAARVTVINGFNSVAASARDAGNTVVNEFGGKISKAMEDLKFKIAIARGDFNQFAAGFPEMARGLGVSFETLTKGVAALSPEMQKLNAQQQLFNAYQLNKEALTPWDQLMEKQRLVQQSLAVLGQDTQEFARIQAKAALDVAMYWGKAAGDIVGNLASGLKAFAEQNKQFSMAAKVAAIAQATINTYLAATKALATYPPPLSYVAAAAAVVAGLGYVAQIQSQSFAAGGKFKVPGGRSGVDNKFVPLNLASGEMVEITPADQAASGGGSAPTVNLRGRRLTDLMTLEDMRDLIDGLNAAHRDGYRLKLTTA